MRKILLILLISAGFVSVCSLSQTKERYMTFTIKEVVVRDSQFVDKLISFMSNDSVIKEIQEHFIPGLDFRSYINNNKIFLRIYVDKRNISLSAYKYRDDRIRIFDDLIDDSLRTVIDKDSLTHVIINISEHTGDDYRAKYKGWNLYFAERETINNKILFRNTGRKTEMTFSLDCVFSGWSDPWIPLIYHNNKLYIEPDSLQWFIMRE